MVDAIGAPLVEYFQALDDPRIDRTKRHHLLARIHRRTPMDGVRKAEGGVRELQGK